jgi:hypothetical protein
MVSPEEERLASFNLKPWKESPGIPGGSLLYVPQVFKLEKA